MFTYSWPFQSLLSRVAHTGAQKTPELLTRNRWQRWGNFRETGWSACGLFRSHRCHLALNWWQRFLFFFPNWRCAHVFCFHYQINVITVCLRAMKGAVEWPTASRWPGQSLKQRILKFRLSVRFAYWNMNIKDSLWSPVQTVLMVATIEVQTQNATWH